MKMIKKLKLGGLNLLALFIATLITSGSGHAIGTFVSYPTPTATSGVGSIAAGPDGNMWFTKTNEDQIGKSTLNGIITEYNLPANTKPAFIAAGPDGNMWFTASNLSINKITTSGTVTSYDISSDLDLGESPFGIAAGPDGNMWFLAGNTSGSGTAKVGKITSSGTVTVYSTYQGGFGLVDGGDGAMWYAQGSAANSVNKIGRVTMAGSVSQFDLPNPGNGQTNIALGADGNFWYLSPPANKIGKMTPAGVFTEYDLPTGAFAYYGIVAAPDGNIWIAESGLGKLARVEPDGSMTEYPMPSGIGPMNLTIGPDGNIWIGTNVGIAKMADTPGETENPGTDNPPTSGGNNTPTPTAPRTGKIIGAIIASSALIGMVVVTAAEIKKTHHIKDASSK